jgi:hypothetical protein
VNLLGEPMRLSSPMIVMRVGNRSPAWLCFENPVNENESR